MITQIAILEAIADELRAEFEVRGVSLIQVLGDGYRPRILVSFGLSSFITTTFNDNQETLCVAFHDSHFPSYVKYAMLDDKIVNSLSTMFRDFTSTKQ